MQEVREILRGKAITAVTIRRAVGDRPYDEQERNLLEFFHEELARLEAAQQRKQRGPRRASREREVLQGFLRGAREKEVPSELSPL
jgi:hypothetical protein